jgi:hypothetical protein
MGAAGNTMSLVGGARTGRASPEDFAGATTFPMPVSRFLAGDYLKRADVMLSRKSGNLYSFLIRWATGSLFSHAALVFHVRDHLDGFNNNFVIEAGTSGVDITNIRDYCNDPYYTVAIKRMNKEWFGDDLQRFVRGHLLDHIKDEYDYWRAITLARALLRAALFRNDRPFSQSDVSKQTRRWVRIRRGRNANEFICSGLVQYGYFNALYKLMKKRLKGEAGGEEAREAMQEVATRAGLKTLSPDMLRDVLFSKELEATLDLDEKGRFKSFRSMRRFFNAMHATTPRDIEETDKLDWLYVIRGGMVHRVATSEDVKAVMRGKLVVPYRETDV